MSTARRLSEKPPPLSNVVMQDESSPWLPPPSQFAATLSSARRAAPRVLLFHVIIAAVCFEVTIEPAGSDEDEKSTESDEVAATPEADQDGTNDTCDIRDDDDASVYPATDTDVDGGGGATSPPAGHSPAVSARLGSVADFCCCVLEQLRCVAPGGKVYGSSMTMPFWLWWPSLDGASTASAATSSDKPSPIPPRTVQEVRAAIVDLVQSKFADIIDVHGSVACEGGEYVRCRVVLSEGPVSFLAQDRPLPTAESATTLSATASMGPSCCALPTDYDLSLPPQGRIVSELLHALRQGPPLWWSVEVLDARRHRRGARDQHLPSASPSQSACGADDSDFRGARSAESLSSDACSPNLPTPPAAAASGNSCDGCDSGDAPHEQHCAIPPQSPASGVDQYCDGTTPRRPCRSAQLSPRVPSRSFSVDDFGFDGGQNPATHDHGTSNPSHSRRHRRTVWQSLAAQSSVAAVLVVEVLVFGVTASRLHSTASRFHRRILRNGRRCLERAMGVVLSCDMVCDEGAPGPTWEGATSTSPSQQQHDSGGTGAPNDRQQSKSAVNATSSCSSDDGASDSSGQRDVNHAAPEDDRSSASVVLQLTCAIPKIESSTRASRFTAHCAEASVSLVETLQRVVAQCWTASEADCAETAPPSSASFSHAAARNDESLPFRIRCCLLQGKLYRCFFSNHPSAANVFAPPVAPSECAPCGAEEAVLLVGGELLERAKRILTDAERHWRELVAAATSTRNSCQAAEQPGGCASGAAPPLTSKAPTTHAARASSSFVVCEESLARFLELFSSEMELLPCVAATTTSNSMSLSSRTTEENSFQFVAVQRLSGSCENQQHSMHRMSEVIDRELLRPEATRQLVGLSAVWDGLLRFLAPSAQGGCRDRHYDPATPGALSDPSISPDDEARVGLGGGVSVALLRGDPLSGKSSVLTECYTRLALLPCVLVDGQACGRTFAAVPRTVSPPSGNAIDDAALCASSAAVVAPLLLAIFSQFELHVQRRTANRCCDGLKTSSTTVDKRRQHPTSLKSGATSATVYDIVEGLKKCLASLWDDRAATVAPPPFGENAAPSHARNDDGAGGRRRCFVLIDDAHLVHGDHVSLDVLDVLVARPIAVDIAVVASTSLEIPFHLRVQLSDKRPCGRPALLSWTVVLPSSLLSLTPPTAANDAASVLIRQHVASDPSTSQPAAAHATRPQDVDRQNHRVVPTTDAKNGDACQLWVSAMRTASADSITTVAMLCRALRNHHPVTKSLQHVMCRAHGLSRFIREHYVTLRLQELLLQNVGECAALAERLTDAVSLLPPSELEWLSRLVCYSLATDSPRVPLAAADVLLRISMMHPASLSPSHSDEALGGTSPAMSPGSVAEARHRLIQELHHIAVCDGRKHAHAPMSAQDSRHEALLALDVPPTPAELLPFHRPALANLLYYASASDDGSDRERKSSLQFVFPASPAMLWKQLPAALRLEACELVSLSSVADGLQTSAKLWLTCAVGSLEDRALLAAVDAELRHLPPTDNLFFTSNCDGAGDSSVHQHQQQEAEDQLTPTATGCPSETLRILTILAEHGYGSSAAAALGDREQDPQQQHHHPHRSCEPLLLDAELEKFSVSCPALQRYLVAVDRIRCVAQARSKKTSALHRPSAPELVLSRAPSAAAEASQGNTERQPALVAEVPVSDGHATAEQAQVSEAPPNDRTKHFHVVEVPPNVERQRPTPLMVSIPNCIPDLNVVLQLTQKAWVAVDTAVREHRRHRDEYQIDLTRSSTQKREDGMCERNLSTFSSAGSDGYKSPCTHATSLSSPLQPPTSNPTQTGFAACRSPPPPLQEGECPRHRHPPECDDHGSTRDAASSAHETSAATCCGESQWRSRSNGGSLMGSFVTPMTATSYLTTPASGPPHAADGGGCVEVGDTSRAHGTFPPDVALPPCGGGGLRGEPQQQNDHMATTAALLAAVDVLSWTWRLCRHQVAYLATHPVDISRLTTKNDGTLLLDTVQLATQRVDALVEAMVRQPTATVVVGWKDAFQDLCQVCATASNALVQQLGKVSRRTTVERIERSIATIPCSLFQSHLRALLSILSHLLQVREAVEQDESITRTQRVVRLQLAASNSVRLCLSQAASVCTESLSLMRQVVGTKAAAVGAFEKAIHFAGDYRHVGWHKVYRMTMHVSLSTLCALDAHVRSNCSAIAEDLMTQLMCLLTFTAHGPLSSFAAQIKERFGDVTNWQLCDSRLCCSSSSKSKSKSTHSNGGTAGDDDCRQRDTEEPWRVAIPSGCALPIPDNATADGQQQPAASAAQQLRCTAGGWKPKRKATPCPPPE